MTQSSFNFPVLITLIASPLCSQYHPCQSISVIKFYCLRHYLITPYLLIIIFNLNCIAFFFRRMVWIYSIRFTVTFSIWDSGLFHWIRISTAGVFVPPLSTYVSACHLHQLEWPLYSFLVILWSFLVKSSSIPGIYLLLPLLLRCSTHS